MPPLSRRDLMKTVAAAGAVAVLPDAPAEAHGRQHADGWVTGHLTGAQAVVETLLQLGTACVFGIPGAQENELWDTMKSKHLPYQLVTHEQAAATGADGYARSTGRPGVLCIVPGPGLTNALTGLGEARLDSIPVVCIVGDVARGDKYRPFQVHELPQAALLRPICKSVCEVQHVAEIPCAIQQAFALAATGEPGPTAVVIPYNLLIETQRFHVPPPGPLEVLFDEGAFQQALCLLSKRDLRVGIYAGLGCMDFSANLTALAGTLQAPVATSICGKGAINETHPLAVGWGYGPQGTETAEHIFKSVDLVLALGVRFSEVSTAFYSLPQHRYLIHVDANPDNLGRIMKTSVCVNADAGLFIDRCLAHADAVRRPCDARLAKRIQELKTEEFRKHQRLYAQCGADPMAFYLALRRCACTDALVFMDVSASEFWAAEAFTVTQPRTFFNPTDNQAMGWSIGAALGAQRVHPGRQTIAIVGDGCFLMGGMEISTAARECLPVKFFVLDDHAYHYMQALQKPAYLRTTATILANLDYRAMAQGLGVAYQEINCTENLEASIRAALEYAGPVLTRVVTDYRKRPLRWVDAAKGRFTKELTAEQKVRFLARIGARSLDLHPDND